MHITDYERVASVSVTQLGEFFCPRCRTGLCRERSPEKRNDPRDRQWDCLTCGRGWVAIPVSVRTVEQAHIYAENRDAEEGGAK